MASSEDPDPPCDTLEAAAPACWRPCERACHATLRWPVHTIDAEPLRHRHPGHPGDTARQPPSARPAQLPPVPPPAHSLLALCGEAGLRRLVHRHMTRLKLTPLFAPVRDCFDCIAERVADFVVESCGGPLYYSERHAHLQAGAGLPVLLDESGRELWLVQLWHSLDDVGLPEHLRADYWHWAEPLSLHLLAPRERRQPLRRYPFELVSGWFRPPRAQDPALH